MFYKASIGNEEQPFTGDTREFHLQNILAAEALSRIDRARERCGESVAANMKYEARQARREQNANLLETPFRERFKVKVLRHLEDARLGEWRREELLKRTATRGQTH